MGLELRLQPSKGYVNPQAFTERYILQTALTQDRSRDGKIDDEYIAASLNSKFEYANFERDLLRSARDAEGFAPYLRGIVIRTGIRHMAFHRDDLTEAQVGRVHHEHRRNVGGARSPDFMEIFNDEQAKWSHHKSTEQPEHLTYYGAVDTTADLFTAIVKEARIHPEILTDRVYNEDLGKLTTVGRGAKAAIGWVTRSVLFGPIVQGKSETTTRLKEYGRRIMRKPREFLLESQRVNGLGVYFQNITDGGLSTMHSTPGVEHMLGNYHKPISYLEVQIGAINALENAAILYPQKASFYKNLAQKMRKSTFKEFYMPDKKYFAAAVDRDEVTGDYRKVETLSIMGASILNSDFFDHMQDSQRQEIIQPIIERLFSNDFLTDAGLRTKAKQYATLIYDPENPRTNAAEYQGSWTIWPALNEDIILGLHRQGFHELAKQLENRMVNFVRENSNAEYAFVIPGNVWIHGQQENLEGIVAQNYKTREEYDGLSTEEKAKIIGTRKLIFLDAPYPQGDQLWTASAVARILYESNTTQQNTLPHSWQEKVEQRIFSQPEWKSISLLSPTDLAKEADNDYFFVIDPKKGGELENKLRAISEQIRQERLHSTSRRKSF